MATTKTKAKPATSKTATRTTAKKAARPASAKTKASNETDLLTKLIVVWLALILVFVLLVVFKSY